jgi:hypothetical protein
MIGDIVLADHHQLKKLMKQMTYVIIATQGQQITEGPPDKEKGKMLYSRCHQYVKEGRFAVDFKDELSSKQDFFKDHNYFDLSLAAGAAACIKAKLLQEEFPLSEDATSIADEDGEKLWKVFSEIKTFSRNECLPKYKEYLRRAQSGNYTDEETLLEIIKESVWKNIAENKIKVELTDHLITYQPINIFRLQAFNKFVSDQKKALGARAPPPSVEQNNLWKEQFETIRGPYYTKLREDWETQNLPKFFLAFVFCGLPGKKFSSLDVAQSKPAGNDSQGSRRAQASALQSGSVGSMLTTPLTSNSSQHETAMQAQAYVAVKQKEMVLYERELDLATVKQKSETRIQKRVLMREYLEGNSDIHCPKRQKVLKQYQDDLFNDIFDILPDDRNDPQPGNLIVQSMTPVQAAASYSSTNNLEDFQFTYDDVEHLI